MIIVKTKNLPSVKGLSGLKNKAWNIVALDLAKRIQLTLKDAKCADHPEQESVITCIANNSTAPVIELTSFCCENFKERIKISKKD